MQQEHQLRSLGRTETNGSPIRGGRSIESDSTATSAGRKPPGVLRFGPFELDLVEGELRRSGKPVALPPQPLRVLGLLARRSGSVVTRGELRVALWGEGTFVDAEAGINFCLRRIREALGDDPARPRYVQTVRGRGYRFVGQLQDAAVLDEVPIASSTALLDSLDDVVAVLDREGNFLFLNHVVLERTGFWPAELLGRRSFELVHIDDRESVRQAFERCLNDPSRPLLVRMRVLDRSGSSRVKEVRLSNRLAEPGVRGIVALFRDVAERR
jgi:PAS domain S-box-containing protein